MITINTNIHTAYQSTTVPPQTTKQLTYLQRTTTAATAREALVELWTPSMPDTLSSRSRCFRILAENTGPLIFLFVLFVVVVSGGRGSSNQMPQQNKNKKGGKKVPAKKQGSAPKKRSPIAEALEDSLSMYKHATVV